MVKGLNVKTKGMVIFKRVPLVTIDDYCRCKDDCNEGIAVKISQKSSHIHRKNYF